MLWGASLGVHRSLRRAKGDSMAPTLVDGQLLVVVSTRLRAARLGDIVIARDPRGASGSWVKRVAAIGPAVRTVAHPVVPDRTMQILVDDDQVLLLGDNPDASTDGRSLGATAISDVTHVVLWPTTQRDAHRGRRATSNSSGSSSPTPTPS